MTKAKLKELEIEIKTLEGLIKKGIDVKQELGDKTKELEMAKNKGNYGIRLEKIDENKYNVFINVEFESGKTDKRYIKKGIAKHYAFQVRNILSDFFSNFLESDIIVKADIIEIMQDNVTKNK